MRLSSRFAGRGPLGLLLVGDLVALVAVVLLGFNTHNIGENVALNLLRVLAPFVIGWVGVAALVGAYRPTGGRAAFLGRSALAWLLGIGLALVLRNTVFGSTFAPVFAVVAYVFNGLFLLGWRAAYAWLFLRQRAGAAPTASPPHGRSEGAR